MRDCPEAEDTPLCFGCPGPCCPGHPAPATAAPATAALGWSRSRRTCGPVSRTRQLSSSTVGCVCQRGSAGSASPEPGVLSGQTAHGGTGGVFILASLSARSSPPWKWKRCHLLGTVPGVPFPASVACVLVMNTPHPQIHELAAHTPGLVSSPQFFPGAVELV